MTAHSEQIERLKKGNPNIRTHLCRQAIRKAVIKRWSDEVKEALEVFKFTPDAFEIDQEESTITIYEVEISNPMPNSKMHTYWQMLHFIEDEDWDMNLIRVDRFGNHTEIDLFHWWYHEGFYEEQEAESKNKHEAQGEPEREKDQKATGGNRLSRG